jgi:hypothetical protein
VRAAAVEIDLAASNLSKSPQSVAHLLNEINNSPDSRSLTLWRLGALGNRGVEPAIVLATLLRYAHDSSQQTRFWAVEGLAMPTIHRPASRSWPTTAERSASARHVTRRVPECCKRTAAHRSAATAQSPR